MCQLNKLETIFLTSFLEFHNKPLEFST